MKKGLKRIVFFVFLMVFGLALSGTIAYAAGDSTILRDVDKTNDYVYAEIDKAVEKADRVMSGTSDEQKLDFAVDRICDKLVEKTENKVDQLIEKASKDNIVVTKEYIPVTIGDQAILVDPCFAH